MNKEIQKSTFDAQPNTKINEIVAAYSKFFLTDIDRKLEAHLNPKSQDKVSWKEKDLV